MYHNVLALNGIQINGNCFVTGSRVPRIVLLFSYSHVYLVENALDSEVIFFWFCQTTSVRSQFTYHQGPSSTLPTRQHQSKSLTPESVCYLCLLLIKFNPWFLQERLDYVEDGRMVFKLRLRICSTLYPVNDGIRDFFIEYDRHVLQTSPPWGSELLEVHITSLKFLECISCVWQCP